MCIRNHSRSSELGKVSKGLEVGALLHEHLGPATVFSVEALSQVQCSADCFPHEHLACEAQTQSPPERPQQVVGTAIVLYESVDLRWMIV